MRFSMPSGIQVNTLQFFIFHSSFFISKTKSGLPRKAVLIFVLGLVLSRHLLVGFAAHSGVLFLLDKELGGGIRELLSQGGVTNLALQEFLIRYSCQ